MFAYAPKITAISQKPDLLYEKEIVKILCEHQVELVVLAGYDKVVGPDILEAFPRELSISILPCSFFCWVERAATSFGIRRQGSGRQCNLVDSSVDGTYYSPGSGTGLEDDTVESLSNRILEAEHRILPLAIKLIAEDRVRVRGRVVRILPAGSKNNIVIANEVFNMKKSHNKRCRQNRVGSICFKLSETRMGNCVHRRHLKTVASSRN